MTRYAIEYLDADKDIVHAEFCEAEAAYDAASLAHDGMREARKEFGAVDFRIYDPAAGLYYASNPSDLDD